MRKKDKSPAIRAARSQGIKGPGVLARFPGSNDTIRVKLAPNMCLNGGSIPIRPISHAGESFDFIKKRKFDDGTVGWILRSLGGQTLYDKRGWGPNYY